MFAFILHSKYTTSCLMAKSVIWHNFQSSSNKQASQKFHYFVLNSHFIQPSECKYVLFVCLSVRLQVSFIPLHFRYFGLRFSLIYRGKVQLYHPLYDFRRKESKLFFVDIADCENLNTRKIIPMFFKQNRENLAMWKYPIIRYFSHDGGQLIYWTDLDLLSV